MTLYGLILGIAHIAITSLGNATYYTLVYSWNWVLSTRSRNSDPIPRPRRDTNINSSSKGVYGRSGRHAKAWTPSNLGSVSTFSVFPKSPTHAVIPGVIPLAREC